MQQPENSLKNATDSQIKTKNKLHRMFSASGGSLLSAKLMICGIYFLML
jgi:hypothetical protein